MDQRKPCTNLTRSVVPHPSAVDRDPGTPCGPARGALDRVCTFGTPKARARREVALVGDSHALHWRPALDVVARARRWRAFSVTTAGCFFSEATRWLPLGFRELCVDWYGSVRRWFTEHPQISTVFVSQWATTPIEVRAGQTELQVKVDGFRSAWLRLPASVTRIVVIRDIPQMDADTLTCVRRVMRAARERPGAACRRARPDAVHRDPAVEAVRLRPSRRYRHVDLTDYFCSRRYCPPVIGGVLTHRDEDHMTNAYSKTLGPFLLRKVNRALAER